MITNTISDRLVGALCNTLLHSLWQGILLAGIAGLIVICTRRKSSALRYNLLVSAMILFAAVVPATFLLQYLKTGDVATAYHTVQFVSVAGVAANGPVSQPMIVAQPGFRDQVSAFLVDHRNTIVSVWFLIICARSLQLGVGLYGTYRLKRFRVSAVKGRWLERMQQLADALGIRQTIAILESGVAKSPMMIGYLKPVILVPIGLLNALSTEEVEAILVHELAHIKRRDYLVNILQNLMEIVLFFNPAVLWVSAMIRTERENCCDDLALTHDKNKANYIRALISCEEYRASAPPIAMAFSGTKNTLLHRVQRLVSNRNYSLNLFEKAVLTICLVAFGLGLSAFKVREDIKKALKPAATVVHPNARASAPVHNSVALFKHILHPAKSDTSKPAFDTTRTVGRELYRENLLTDTDHLSIRLNERELIVNGVRMPEEVHERIYSQFGRNGNFEGSDAQLYENKHPSPNGLQERSEEIGAELVRDNLVGDKNHFSFKLSRDEFSIDGVRQSDELLRRIVDKYFKPDENFNLSYTFQDPGSHAYNDNKGYSSDSNRYHNTDTYYHNSDAYFQSLREEEKRAEDKIDKKLVADLLQDDLITDPKNVAFTLNDKMLMVNGKKQSDEMYRKYKEKYRPGSTGSGWSWNYSHHE